MKAHVLREFLINQAESDFIELMKQLDYLLDLATFYTHRYPPETPARIYHQKELAGTIDRLSDLSVQLADVVKRWRTGAKQEQTKESIETNIIAEFWLNLEAMEFFFTSKDIDPAPFSHLQSKVCFNALLMANRVLSA